MGKLPFIGAVVTAFLLGVLLGWKAYDWRVRYLRHKRDYYSKKAMEIHEKIES